LIDKEIASTDGSAYTRHRMRPHWLKPGLGALVILLPLIVVGQPPDMPDTAKAPPRKALWSLRYEPMVDIAKACPGICIEMRYATERNLAGKVIYPLRARALIRKSVARRLIKVQDELRRQGFGLKIWDAYRPAWAQDLLWKASPNPEFLADPARGGSCHTWGVSVDVTLVDLQGREQKMATDFDDLSMGAKSAYVGGDPGIAARMAVLRKAMLNAGFTGIRDEWWHFTAQDAWLFAPVDMALEDFDN
jgi:D-alanyl-D-alanine dipeptidase